MVTERTGIEKRVMAYFDGNADGIVKAGKKAEKAVTKVAKAVRLQDTSLASFKSATSRTAAVTKSFPVQKMVDGSKQLDGALKSATSQLDTQLDSRSKFAKDSYAKHMKGLDTTFKNVFKSSKGATRGVTDIDKFMKNLGTSTKKTNKQMKGFDMNALGLLFFGMAIQRVFVGIGKASTDMFTKIMEATESGASNIQILGSMFDYLKFTIGSAINTALGPLIPRIFEIISAMTTWIQKHPELTAKIIALGAALGTALFSYATLKLGIGALVGSFSGISGKVATNLGGQDWSTVGATISKAIGLVAIVWGLAKITQGAIDIATGEVSAGIKQIVQGFFTTAGGLLIRSGNPYAVAIGVTMVLLSSDTFIDAVTKLLNTVGGEIVKWATFASRVLTGAFSKDPKEILSAAKDLSNFMDSGSFETAKAQFVPGASTPRPGAGIDLSSTEGRETNTSPLQNIEFKIDMSNSIVEKDVLSVLSEEVAARLSESVSQN